MTEEMGLPDLTARVRVDTTDVAAAKAETAGMASEMSAQFKELGGVIAGAFAIGAVVDFAKESWTRLGDISKANQQTAAVIASTGDVSNVTASQVRDLAKAIEEKSSIDAVQITKGEDMLLTFTHIRNEVGAGNDVFNQATQATTDLSVAMGKDMQSSAILVGKALQDPIKGMTALQRIGVTLSAEQKQQVKDFMAVGDIMDAQKVILAELNKEFGGSAEALGNSVPGAVNRMKESIVNAGAKIFAAVGPIATTLLPPIAAALGLLSDHLGWVELALGVLYSKWILLKIAGIGETVLSWAASFRTLASAEGIAGASSSLGNLVGKIGTSTPSISGLKGLLGRGGVATAGEEAAAGLAGAEGAAVGTGEALAGAEVAATSTGIAAGALATGGIALLGVGALALVTNFGGARDAAKSFLDQVGNDTKAQEAMQKLLDTTTQLGEQIRGASSQSAGDSTANTRQQLSDSMGVFYSGGMSGKSYEMDRFDQANQLAGPQAKTIMAQLADNKQFDTLKAYEQALIDKNGDWMASLREVAANGDRTAISLISNYQKATDAAQSAYQQQQDAALQAFDKMQQAANDSLGKQADAASKTAKDIANAYTSSSTSQKIAADQAKLDTLQRSLYQAEHPQGKGAKVNKYTVDNLNAQISATQANMADLQGSQSEAAQRQAELLTDEQKHQLSQIHEIADALHTSDDNVIKFGQDGILSYDGVRGHLGDVLDHMNKLEEAQANLALQAKLVADGWTTTAAATRAAAINAGAAVVAGGNQASSTSGRLAFAEGGISFRSAWAAVSEDDEPEYHVPAKKARGYEAMLNSLIFGGPRPPAGGGGATAPAAAAPNQTVNVAINNPAASAYDIGKRIAWELL